jgi:hypothetical protein
MAADKTQCDLIDKVNDRLRLEVLAYCQMLADSGFDCDEISQILMQRGPEIERWRQETLAKVARWLDEPGAPSFEVQ